MTCCCISLLGYAAAAFIFYHFLRILYDVFFPYFIAPLVGLDKKIGQYSHPGEYAVITGATDGIGKAYAKEFARRGFKLVLISRSDDKLKAVAAEIKEQFSGTEIVTIQFDFNTSDVKSYTKIANALKDLKISALVNNVGVSYDYPQVIDLVPNGDEVALKLLNVNCLSAIMMIRTVLPKLKELGRGIVINISSASARFAPIPLLGVYAACKKFIAFLTDSTRSETENPSIFFQTVYPLFVATNMSRIKRPSFFAPNADNYARQAMKTIGLQTSTVGCFSHAIQEAGIKVAYAIGLGCVVESFMLKTMKQNRKRAMKKE